MKIINNTADLNRFLTEILDSATFQIDRIDFDSQDSWVIKDGALTHKLGGFFHIIGVENGAKKESDLFLFQPQSALTGILIHKSQGEIYILVQARIEPGNTGVIQLGPTVQSTPSNYLRVHGGKHTSYLDYFYSFNKHVVGFNSSNHLDLGKRYYQKTKWLNYAETDKFTETDDSFAWVSLRALLELSSANYLLNTDLRSLLAVYDWDAIFEPKPQKALLDSQILNYLNKSRLNINCEDRFISLKEADNIVVAKNTIYCKKDSGSEVGLYKIATKYREVGSWIQPLWSATERGLVTLLCRNYNSNEETEFLITVENEEGISGQHCISASYLRYPNEEIDSGLKQIGTTLKEFYQSDEGGRFINHEYLFRVAEVAQDFEIQKNQFWLKAWELKSILSISNLANIQLRNICSAVIYKLNPHLKAQH
jgi:oxidase EvaA